MNFRADLHCHTCFSDGTDSPEALIDLALNSGLLGLSITDHDTIQAYTIALPYAQEKCLSLLPGVEFSASHQASAVHVLGYAFSLKSEAIQHLCHRHKLRRLNRNRCIVQRLKKLGIKIEEEKLEEAHHTVGRPHIAKAMMDQGVVSSIKEAFDHYLGEGKAAYDPGEPISVLETIDSIHEGGGQAIIAHPHLIKRSSTIRQLLHMPFDGLEGYYARFSAQQEEKWIAIAQEKGWIITGGSDYHGTTKPFNILGSSWVGEETFRRLYEHSQLTNS